MAEAARAGTEPKPSGDATPRLGPRVSVDKAALPVPQDAGRCGKAPPATARESEDEIAR